MFNFISVMAKYFTVVIIVFYTFLAFDVFIVRKRKITKEESKDLSKKQLKELKNKYHKEYRLKKKSMFIAQYCLIMIMHTLNFFVLYSYDYNYKILLLGVAELIFMIVATKVYRKVYDGISRLLFNNMLFLLDIGFIMLCRLSFDGALKQFIIIVIGTASCLVIPGIIGKIGYLDKYDWKYGLVGIGMLLYVLFFGTTNYGATNWLKIGIITFQPSEFVKVLFVFCMASLLSKYKDDKKKVLIITAFATFYVIVLALEKDLGGALLFFVTYVIMLYIATKKKRYLGAGALAGILAALGAYNIPNYRHVRVRVNAWLNPWDVIETDGYQVAQSLFAIGTGGWFGMGLMRGMPKSIPVHVSDFIFSAICEEMGCIVGIMIILVYISCYIMFINIAMLFGNLFYKLIAMGLSTIFIFQVFLTIGGAVKFIPSTGVTLPLISYGGSSVFSTLIIFSVIQGMYVRREYIQKLKKEAKSSGESVWAKKIEEKKMKNM